MPDPRERNITRPDTGTVEALGGAPATAIAVPPAHENYCYMALEGGELPPTGYGDLPFTPLSPPLDKPLITYERDTPVAAPVHSAWGVQATGDDDLIDLWLKRRPATTQRAYSHDVAGFRERVGKSLRATTLRDLHDYAETLAGQAQASQNRRLAAIKSLLTFGHKIGYLAVNVGGALETTSVRGRRAERIVGEAEVARLLAGEPDLRNHALMRLFYTTGLRISELCSLSWRDVVGRKAGGQVTVMGKGGKTRAVLCGPKMHAELMTLRRGAAAEAPVFVSRNGTRMHVSSVHRVIKAAARRVGLPATFSAHWLRHCHASHALENGATLATVRDGLGHSSVKVTSEYLHARPGEGSSSYVTD